MESDSKLIIDMLNKRCIIPPDNLVLIADCMAYSQGMDISFLHTFREGNFYVNFLAKLGVKSNSPLTYYSHPIVGIGPLLNAYLSEVNWERVS